ncbi:helix-turn-helix domain-containing protein [Cetobacterium sp.]|uniref:helix-turn-helix domain-containing protein n=1 Tax=Cetobacterium sp. TaxID=2071632 RepID=UPI003F3C06FF
MNRLDKFILDLSIDMKKRGIRQRDIIEGVKISSSALSKTLNGKTLSKEILDKIINYIDNPENWKK